MRDGRISRAGACHDSIFRPAITLLLVICALFDSNFVYAQSDAQGNTQSGKSEVRELGKSTNGHPIEVYRFGNGWRRIVLIGGIHGGYERNTVKLAWQMIDYFSADPTRVPADLLLEIIPVANPDGLVKVVGSAGRSAIDKPALIADPYLGRFNGNNVDLNRNWDCDWNSVAAGPRGRVSGGTSAMSEAETRILADFLVIPSPVAVVVWHSSANGVYASNCRMDFAASTALAERYARASGYPFRSAFSAYPITGDLTNWLAIRQIPAITIELRTQSDSEFDQNLRGVQALLTYYSNNLLRCNRKEPAYVNPRSCQSRLQP